MRAHGLNRWAGSIFPQITKMRMGTVTFMVNKLFTSRPLAGETAFGVSVPAEFLGLNSCGVSRLQPSVPCFA
jgi:hypothetical protein